MDGKTDGIIEDQITCLQMFTREPIPVDNFNGGFDWNTDYTMKIWKSRKTGNCRLHFNIPKTTMTRTCRWLKITPTLPLSIEMPELVNDGNNNEVYHPGRLCASAYKRPNWKPVEKWWCADPQWLCQQLKEYRRTISTRSQFLNIFDYDQNVAAAYLSSSFYHCQKWNFVASADEHTNINGKFLQGEAAPFKNA